MTTEELKQFLLEQGYRDLIEIPGRGLCGLNRYLYTTGLVIGLDEGGLKGRYCYEFFSEAYTALKEWDGVGDPPGDWIKYKGEGGERSNPNKKD